LRRILILAVGILAGCHPRPLAPVLFPGSIVWQVPLDDAIEGPLATDSIRIFVATRDGAIRALEQATGLVIWKVQGRPGWIAYGAGLLILRQEDGTTFGLEPATGIVRWKASSGIGGRIVPVIDGDRILVAGEGLACLETTAGRKLWAIDAPQASTVPSVAGGRIVLGESDGTLRCRDRSTGASLWTYKTSKTLLATPITDGKDRVFIGATDHRFLSLSLKNGKQEWRWKVGADVQAPAMVYADKVLFASHEAVLYALKRRNGNMIWRAPIPARPLSAPIRVGNRVIVACPENEILGFDLKTGKPVGSMKTPKIMTAAPILLGDNVYVGSSEPSVVALKFGPGPSPEELPKSTAPGPPIS